MITPVELEGKVFKSGLGYDKKEVDMFFKYHLEDYESLYTANADHKEKILELEGKLDYYKSIEKTLQKALILAEKTVESTKLAAEKEAKLIIDEARLKAESIVKDSRNEVDNIRKQSVDLIQQYEIYKAQFKQITKAQMELLESEAFEIQIVNLSGAVHKEREATAAKAETELEVEAEEVDTNSDNLDSSDKDYNIEFFNLNEDE